MDAVEAAMYNYVPDSRLSCQTYIKTTACGMLLLCLAEILGVSLD